MSAISVSSPRQGMKSAQSQPSGSQVAAGSHTDVRAPIVAGLVLLAVFVRVELRVKAPSFDPRLLAQRTFGGGNAALGFSPMKAGLANIPTAIGALIGAPLAARPVRRFSLCPVTVPALTMAALTMGGHGFLGLRTPLVQIEILLSIQGLSIGMVIGPVTAALISNLPLEQAGARSCRSCTDVRSNLRWRVDPVRCRIRHGFPPNRPPTSARAGSRSSHSSELLCC
ncbi:hypothetical protein ACFXDH_40710 [Streptomyces sp. NPDC059467]|uniref:hypothetical protein n=1 Tax=Streptomyces sp. NPDC059467 TaxID=3346844 RepID=UPI0036AA16CE